MLFHRTISLQTLITSSKVYIYIYIHICMTDIYIYIYIYIHTYIYMSVEFVWTVFFNTDLAHFEQNVISSYNFIANFNHILKGIYIYIYMADIYDKLIYVYIYIYLYIYIREVHKIPGRCSVWYTLLQPGKRVVVFLFFPLKCMVYKFSGRCW